MRQIAHSQIRNLSYETKILLVEGGGEVGEIVICQRTMQSLIPHKKSLRLLGKILKKAIPLYGHLMVAWQITISEPPHPDLQSQRDKETSL